MWICAERDTNSDEVKSKSVEAESLWENLNFMLNLVVTKLIKYNLHLHAKFRLKKAISIGIFCLGSLADKYTVIFHIPNEENSLFVDHDGWWYETHCEVQHLSILYLLLFKLLANCAAGRKHVFSAMCCDWLIKRYCVPEGKVYGFLQHPEVKAEQDNNKVPASFSTWSHCVFSQLSWSAVRSRRWQWTSLLLLAVCQLQTPMWATRHTIQTHSTDAIEKGVSRWLLPCNAPLEQEKKNMDINLQPHTVYISQL